MKKKILDSSINLINRNNSFSETKLAEIRYGLEAVYLTITKLVIILIIASILGILKEFIIFTLLYNTIRFFSFGLHASKSFVCLIVSTLIFIFIPFLATVIDNNLFFNIIVGTISVILIFIYAPADTKKRPLINRKKRARLKIISVGIALVYLILSLIITSSFISNCLIFALATETILILPITYKLFNASYGNYKYYSKSFS